MALDGAFDNPKIRRLSRALRLPPWAGLGLMEALWSWARKGGARNGRIELPQWDDIADRLSWHEPSENLRAALVKEGLIDARDGWDWIHDLHHHADNTNRRYLEKHGQDFANGAPPREPAGGYDDEYFPKVEHKPGKVEQNVKSAESHARTRPVPVPVPVPVEQEHYGVGSDSSRRRSEEKKENPELKTSGERTEQAHGLSSFGDDDEKALGENPKKYLTALMAKATGGQPDPKLLRDIEMAVLKAGGTIAAFARDVHPRIMRLRDPPKLSFFLHQARQFGETAEQSNAAVDAKVAILASRLELLKPPKVHIDQTPGCGCIRGMLIANGKPQYCVCQAGVNLKNGKRANDAK